MEFIILVPIMIVVFWLREAGLTWTAIMLLWDTIICGMYWLIFCFDRKSEEKNVKPGEKLIFALIFAVTLCLTALILIDENELTFYCSAVLPIMTSSLWFIIRLLRED